MENLNLHTDQMLIASYASGCNEAFDRLLERHKSRVYTYILYKVKESELADDIFQETFIKVITTIKQGRYIDDGRFVSWVLRIAHNLVIDHFRQGVSERYMESCDEDSSLLNSPKLCDDTIEDRLIQGQIHADLRSLITALPEAQRSVLIMRYYENLSFKEIAEKHQVSINTALGRMRYAIQNMRKIAQERSIVLTQ